MIINRYLNKFFFLKYNFLKYLYDFTQIILFKYFTNLFTLNINKIVYKELVLLRNFTADMKSFYNPLYVK